MCGRDARFAGRPGDVACCRQFGLEAAAVSGEPSSRAASGRWLRILVGDDHLVNHTVAGNGLEATAGIRPGERCLAAGMDAYITKPAPKSALIEMIARFAPERGSIAAD